MIETPIDIEILKLKLISKYKKNTILNHKTFGNLAIDSDQLEIKINDEIQKISLIELKILNLLIDSANLKLSRDEILVNVWESSHVDSRTIDVHISHLRKKLIQFDHQIQSIYGGGYILRKKPLAKNRDCELIVKSLTKS